MGRGDGVGRDENAFKKELSGVCYLIFSIGLLRMFEYTIAKAKYLLQSVFGILQVDHLETILVAVLDERRLEQPKHLLQYVLFAH